MRNLLPPLALLCLPVVASAQTVCAAAPVYARADSLIAEANRQNGPRKTVVRGLAQRLKIACPAVVPVPPDTQPAPIPPPDPVALPTPTTIQPGFLTAPGPTVPTLTPTFSWSAVSGATGYVLAIRDLAANVIVYPSASGVGPPIPATALTLPAGVLVAGTAYAWDVTAVTATSKSLASANRYFTTAAATPIPPLPTGGVAELPRVYLDFPYPTPNRVVQVPAGASLQSALDVALRGDELVLAAGAKWTGNYTVSSCGGGWITVRGGGTLPAIGTRVNPSLVAATMPKVVTPNTQAAFTVTSSGCRLRLVGFEITVDPALTAQQYGIVDLNGSELVLDRMLVRGATNTQTSRCVTLNSRSTSIQDSWIDECHGKGFQAQGIGGWAGAGPFKIVNNYIAGSGENIMFGGAPLAASLAGMNPSDIEIRGNHLYTPVAWKGVWYKGNLLETKSALRMLIEGNVLDGSWTDAQTGWAIILKSENQQGGCKWCYTADVTIRRNLIRNAGGGINIAPTTNGADSTTSRILIYENVLENIGVGAFTGDQRGFQLLTQTKAVTIERNVLAGVLSSAIITEGGTPCVFKDNVLNAGNYGVIASSTAPGTASITYGCGTGYQWSGMALIGSSSGNPYPSGTTWLTSESQSPLAAQIRAIVSTATAGVVIQP